ncbi:MAG: diacylglycerol/lipid kinase family protein [Fidelibacterota bacterium]
MKTLIVMNPKAGRGKTPKILPKIEQMLTSAGIEFDVEWTREPTHGTEITRAAVNDYDVITAFGGDGTVNEVVNGLAGSETPLGVLPIGTGNDLARGCGIPLSPEKAVDTLIHGTPRKIDLGMFNGRYFSNVVGIGFDGYSSKESRKITKLRGTLVYIWVVLKTLKKYNAINMTIEMDNNRVEGPTYLFSIGNGWSVGGGMQLTPSAILDDGVLSLCHVSDIKPMKVIRNFLKLFNGKIDEIEEVTMYSSQKVRISSEEHLPIHYDGEIPEGEVFSVKIDIIPGGLSVISKWDDVNRGISS